MNEGADVLLGLIDGMEVHGGRAKPAPHKALLVALIARMRAGHPGSDRLVRYLSVENDMKSLLRLVGRSARPHYPFVRMRSEPFWELEGEFPVNDAGDVLHVADLRDPSVRGGFRAEYDQLVTDPEIADQVITRALGTWLTRSDAVAARGYLSSAVGRAT